MEGNFSCSLCSAVAVHCCLCASPRVYLCQGCTGVHTAEKGICHPVVPAAIPSFITAENLPHYTRKVTAIRSLTASLTSLRTWLLQEKSRLEDVFREVWKEEMRKLEATLVEVYRDIGEYYDRLEREIEEFKQDLLKAEQEETVSELVEIYVERGFHIPEPCVFLDIKEKFRLVSITKTEAQPLTENSLLAWLSPSLCACPDCTSLQAALHWSHLPLTCENCGLKSPCTCVKCSLCTQYLPSTGKCYNCNIQYDWKCRYCGMVNSNTDTCCRVCCNKLDMEDWKCFGCGKCNPEQQEMCVYCQSSKELGLYLVNRGGVEVAEDMKMWRCKQCKQLNNLFFPCCIHCGQEDSVMSRALQFKGWKKGAFRSFLDKF